MRTIHFKTIDSTNSYLKKNYKDVNHFTWICSEIQTDGRGRMHKKWFGNQDSLMCSTIIKNDISTASIGLYPLLAVQSLHKVLSKYHKDITIKWPNDLFLNKKKLAGILTESIIESNEVLALVIGFGVNLNQKGFADEIKDIATSLYMNTKQVYDKAFILRQLADQLESDIDQYHLHPLHTIKYCNKHHCLKGLQITFNDNQQSYMGKALDINEHGQLMVRTKDKLFLLNSGEVSLNRK